MTIALLAFADTSVLSRSYASRLGDRVDQSRELGGLAAANVATGLFQGFPISSSSSRTPVAGAAGSRTQLTGVVAAATIGIVLGHVASVATSPVIVRSGQARGRASSGSREACRKQ